MKTFLEKFFIKYGLIQEYGSEIDEYLFESIKKPLVNWIFKIILTSIPIYFMILLITFQYQLYPQSLGISILWWLIVEFWLDITGKGEIHGKR